MPYYLAIGVSKQEFMESCPKELEPYLKAHKLVLHERDYMNWLSNQYTLSAVYVAVEHCLAGKKAKSEYVKQPFLQEIHEKEEIPEEKRIEMENYKLAMSLRIMQANFEINRSRKEKE